MGYYNDENRVAPLRLPDLDEDEDSAVSQILDYKHRFFNRLSNYRNRIMTRQALNINYLLGRQWIELDADIIQDGSRGYVFRDMRRSDMQETPRPVTNLVYPAVEVELAALTKRDFVPNILSNSNDPKTEAAARVATDILNHKLRMMDWNSIRRRVTQDMIVTGTGCLKSYWDESFSDTTQVVQTCWRCPKTGTLFASNTVPRDMKDQVQFNTETLGDLSGNPDDLSMPMSPMAPQTPLEEYEPTPEEAGGEDPFGRPLTMEVPRGECHVEVVSPFDLFVENSGIGVTPDTCQVWGQATVRSMDWMHERVPDMIDEIEPEDPADLMRWHPTLGEWTLLGNYNGTLDSSIYEDHVTLYEMYIEKNFRFPQGRMIWVAGEELLYDGPLYREVQDKEVAVTKFAAATYIKRDGEFNGNGLVDYLISPQNRVNGMDAQIIESRERLGSPHVLVRSGLGFEGPSFVEEWGVGKFLSYTPDPMAPNYEPKIFGNESMDTRVYEERDRIRQDMKEIAGPQDVEIGEAPRNITTTSGLQILGEQAERRRGAREAGIVSAFEKIWSHQLELLWVLRVEGEEDTYSVETDNGSWADRQFSSEDIAGQTKVKVEKQAYIDRSLYQKEAAREAQMDQLYMVDSPAARKRLLELRGLPTDVNENTNYQVDSARRMWVDFRDNGIIPTIDKTLDDPAIHFEVLQAQLKSPDGKDISDAIGWPAINKALAGWEEAFTIAYQNDTAARQFYGGVVEGPEAEMMYAQALEGHAQQMAQFEEQQALQAQAVESTGGAPPNAPLEPPAPPPPPTFLPDALEDKVMAVWNQHLTKKGAAMLPETELGGDSQQAFLMFRAIIEAYKILKEEQLSKMMMGVPDAQTQTQALPEGPDPSNFSSPPPPPEVGG